MLLASHTKASCNAGNIACLLSVAPVLVREQWGRVIWDT